MIRWVVGFGANFYNSKPNFYSLIVIDESIILFEIEPSINSINPCMWELPFWFFKKVSV